MPHFTWNALIGYVDELWKCHKLSPQDHYFDLGGSIVAAKINPDGLSPNYGRKSYGVTAQTQ